MNWGIGAGGEQSDHARARNTEPGRGEINDWFGSQEIQLLTCNGLLQFFSLYPGSFALETRVRRAIAPHP